MANNENRDRIIAELLKIGREYLLPIAKQAFYDYRDRILDAYKVSDEDRAALLSWIFEGQPDAPTTTDPTTDPVDPVPAVPGMYLTAFDPPVPSRDELLARGYVEGDRVCGEGGDSDWMVVQKGQSTLGAKVLFTI